MHSTYKRLLEKLHKKYPEKYLSISSTYRYFDHTDEYKTEYYFYIEDMPEASKHLPTLAEVEKYVQYLCEKGV